MKEESKMKQAEYVRGGAIEISEVPVPSAGPGEVRVRISHVGICGTDLHLLHGAMDHRTGERRVFGHETSGTVEDVGAGVDDVTVGQHVAIMPLRWCGHCPACRAGNSHVCQNLVFLGIDASGALQEYLVVPAHLLVPLGTSIPEAHGALVEPTAVAVHDVRRAALRAGEQALVVGGGPIGFLIAVVARQLGADVRLVETDSFRRSISQKVGLVVLDPAATSVKDEVAEWTEGAGAAVTFEVSGAQAGISTAVDCLAVRGRLGLVAVHPQLRDVDLHQLFWRELTVIGSRLYDRSDFERAAELLGSGIIPAETLITHRLPLESVGIAAETLLAKKDVMKVLVNCRA